jgi:hypothetical protein
MRTIPSSLFPLLLTLLLFTKAGVYGDPSWIKEARAALPPTVFAPEPPPLAIPDDFEAPFNHEWRDQASPYRTGPSIWIENGKLRASGQELTEIPISEWVRIEVRAGLGQKADGTWSLTVSQSGKPPVHKSGLPCAKGWKSLNWLGFVSQASQPTAFHLDDLKVSNQPWTGREHIRVGAGHRPAPTACQVRALSFSAGGFPGKHWRGAPRSPS